MGISIGVIIGIVAMLGFGIGNAMSQPYIRALGPIKGVYVRNVIMTLMILCAMPFFLGTVHFEWLYAVMTVGLAFFAYLPLLSFFRAMEIGKVGVVTPVANSSAFVTAALAVAFFGEQFSLERGFGLLAIFIGIVLISLNFQDWKNSAVWKAGSGLHYAFISMFGWGVMFFFLNIPIDHLGPVLTSVFLEGGVALAAAIHLISKKQRLRVEKQHVWKPIIVSALLISVASVLLNLGFQISDVSIVAPIAFANPVISTLYAGYVFTERLTKQQYIAVAAIILGIILLSV